MQGQAKLKCKVGQGMFDWESGIVVNGSDRKYELLIDTDLVELQNNEARNGDGDGFIEVLVVLTEGNRFLIQLPRQTVFGGSRIRVNKSELVVKDGYTVGQCN